VSESRSRDPFSLVPLLRGPGTTETVTTVLVAFVANLLIAAAKSVAAGTLANQNSTVTAGAGKMPRNTPMSIGDFPRNRC
jgi:hypothetical protein